MRVYAASVTGSDIMRYIVREKRRGSTNTGRCWNTDDFDERHNDASDHVFARSSAESVAGILRAMPPWLGTDEARFVLAERARLWRYLSGKINPSSLVTAEVPLEAEREATPSLLGLLPAAAHGHPFRRGARATCASWLRSRTRS